MKTIPLKSIFVHYFKLLFQLVAPVLLVSSCDSFVEVDLPESQLTNTAVFDNYNTASAALTDIYSKLRDQGLLSGTPSGLSNQLGNYSDELSCYSAPGDPALLFYTNSLLASNTTIAEYWNISYNQIYAANAIIQGIENSNALTDKQKNTLKGQSLFVRALLHFYLTNLYGAVPYVTSIDYKSNNIVKKSARAEVYLNLISDLESAVSLLEPTYGNPDRIVPNKFTAQALLARVYLYKEDYSQASNAASAVLNASQLYALEDNLDLVFRKASKETLWQLQPSVEGKNTDEAGSFIFFSGPPPLVALTDDLVNSFAANDLRKSSWILAVSDGTDTWYHCYKYKEFEYTPTSVEYSIVFRLAEQYLIRAEARAFEGDLIGAKEDLDKIRKRAGLNPTPAITKEELLEAIEKERRWELFTEYGHRFFDLKRSRRIDAVLSVKKPGWNTTDVLFPLPQNELSVNLNLRPQNSGY